jgi:hypothetical protein
MRQTVITFLFFFLAFKSIAQQKPQQWMKEPSLYKADWLVQKVQQRAAIYMSSDAKDIHLYNGLVKRSFRLQPNLVCTDFKNIIQFM